MDDQLGRCLSSRFGRGPDHPPHCGAIGSGVITTKTCSTRGDRYHAREHAFFQKVAFMTAPVPETRIVSQWKIACDGDGPALGHPRVWLTIPEDKGFVECGYCDRRFIHESAASSVK